ncbi:hypothetical protein [Methylobacterium sp. WL9]|uniref:hypothetical protein n=1 Tax=Methylobacterium sp. WL9 TaxID=2603898 RepID=UPI0011C8EC85|nr:hypothetical protein [Methylobacterium sp. WL9]TXN20785.1 hypothetical protein FV217_16785 [Methylobacterium sp. WL9]
MTAAVLHSRDNDGRLVVGVPLSNRPGHRAWLYAADYETIVADHGPRPWLANGNGHGKSYVRLRCADRGNLVMVARLVFGDAEARSIRYRDGDSLNLRSRNLAVRKPRGAARA